MQCFLIFIFSINTVSTNSWTTNSCRTMSIPVRVSLLCSNLLIFNLKERKQKYCRGVTHFFPGFQQGNSFLFKENHLTDKATKEETNASIRAILRMLWFPQLLNSVVKKSHLDKYGQHSFYQGRICFLILGQGPFVQEAVTVNILSSQWTLFHNV